jgi:spore maturation protein CgeB
MKKVFLVTSTDEKYPTFAYQCKIVFKSLGFDQKTFNFRKFYFNRNVFTNNLLNKKLLSEALKHNPDFVLVDKGNSLLPGIIKKISDEGIKTVNWNMDEPFGEYNKADKINNIPEYDSFFTFEPYYLPQLKKLNANSFYLPCYADTTIHSEIIPVKDRKYVCDVSFIGSHRSSRQKIMESLAGHKMKIWGYRWPNINKDSPVYKSVEKRILVGSEMAKYFNLSKININVHFDYSKTAPNLRTFEIPITNSFELCDYFSEIPKMMKTNKEIVFYHDIKELKELIDYYLRKENEQERLAIARAGQKRVLKEHTLKHRLKNMLKTAKI